MLCKCPCYPRKPNLPEAPDRALTSSLATKPWLKGCGTRWDYERTPREGAGTRALSPLLLGNKKD